MREKLTDYKAENELLGRMITDLKVRPRHASNRQDTSLPGSQQPAALPLG
jgi:hypothetical protein